MPRTFFLLRENLAGYRKVRRPSFWCARLAGARAPASRRAIANQSAAGTHHLADDVFRHLAARWLAGFVVETKVDAAIDAAVGFVLGEL